MIVPTASLDLSSEDGCSVYDLFDDGRFQAVVGITDKLYEDLKKDFVIWVHMAMGKNLSSVIFFLAT